MKCKTTILTMFLTEVRRADCIIASRDCVMVVTEKLPNTVEVDAQRIQLESHDLCVLGKKFQHFHCDLYIVSFCEVTSSLTHTSSVT